MPLTPKSSPEAGFTLIVIATLFVAFSVIAAVAVERNTTVQQIARRDAAIAQLDRLALAILEYSVFNASSGVNRYPCPARLDLATSNSDFGRALDNGTPTPAGANCHTTLASSVDQPGGSDTIRGMVPVQTLAGYGISINDAFDPWGNRIVYVVNRTLTPNGTASQTNNPTISENWTSYSIPSADFILISLGKDSIGAYRRGSTSVGITCPTSNPNSVYRHENCDNDADFYLLPTYTSPNANGSANRSASPPSNTYFDDLLVFYRQ